MSANYTHSVVQHDCRISYTFDNRAARIEYPEGSGKQAEEFTSEPLEFKRVAGVDAEGKPDGSEYNKSVRGEPTATMQALHAAKALFIDREAAQAKADGDKVAAAVAKAKAKAVAASTPKPKAS